MAKPKPNTLERPSCRTCRCSWVLGVTMPVSHRAYRCEHEDSPHYRMAMPAEGSCDYYRLATNGRMCQALRVEKVDLRVDHSAR